MCKNNEKVKFTYSENEKIQKVLDVMGFCISMNDIASIKEKLIISDDLILQAVLMRNLGLLYQTKFGQRNLRDSDKTWLDYITDAITYTMVKNDIYNLRLAKYILHFPGYGRVQWHHSKYALNKVGLKKDFELFIELFDEIIEKLDEAVN